ncbi:uncharacterized protein LOC100212229 isoform X1 [Hydra vulgaris]|uniref:uncharacterized protein LOC100212229 isoform X1 n=2 Tax=Hydra vulgaris TaxID=6087 RepID=UPI001F5EF2C8|nr:uncharacterized protein LOC100212229 isoform X1 [Hydra vulgaris]
MATLKRQRLKITITKIKMSSSLKSKIEITYLKILTWLLIAIILLSIAVIALIRLCKKKILKNKPASRLLNSIVNYRKDPFDDFVPSEVEYLTVVNEDIETPPNNFSLEKKSLKKDHVKENKNNTRKIRAPQICFQFNYDIRKNELEVYLIRGINLPKYVNQNIVVSLMLSNNSSVYYSNYVGGPDPNFKQRFRFPLESTRISEDPPLRVKFNIWTVDLYSKKSPYGYVSVSLEEIFVTYGLTPTQDKGIVRKDVIQSTNLVDDHNSAEVYIHTTYLASAQRFSVVLSQAKNLNIDPFNKEIQGRVTLIHLHSERKTYSTDLLQAKKHVNFNEEFVFQLTDLDIRTTEGIDFKIEILSRIKKTFSKPIVIGNFFIGTSISCGRFGNEHWKAMMSSNSTISRWHQLNPN